MINYTLLFLLLISAFSCNSQQNNNAPSGLMTEFIRDPAYVPISDLKPEFTWIVPSNAGIQTCYQILVASSVQNLEKDIADIWDSNKTPGSRSNEIELGAAALKTNTRYYWKVRIWNEKDEVTEYSEIQPFLTGSSVNYLTTENRFLETIIEPEEFIKTSEGSYFIDFGKDAFGTVILELNAPGSDTLIIHLGEKLITKNSIDRNPGGSIRYQKVLLPLSQGKKTYVLDLPADKRNTGPAAILLPDSIGVITPFRYCEVENCNMKLKPSNIKQIATFYFFDDEAASFTSSDTILNKVWDISKYSMKATSFAGLYVDGDRERIPYEADAYINQLGHYYTDREYSIARRTNEYFIEHPTWPTEWILHTIPMFYYDYMYTGNIESLKYYYEELKHKALTALARPDGLISSKKCTDELMQKIGFSNTKQRLRDIVDWPPSQKDTGWKLATPEGERDGYELVEINTVVNAFYYNGLVKLSKLAGYLGKDADSEYYLSLSQKVKKSINDKLLDANTGIYTDGESSLHSSLHANMMVLAFNIVPDENRSKVLEFIKSRGMACSVYGSQYLLEGIYLAGEADYAYELLTSTSDRSWWNMIRSGSTITMEAWDMKYKPNSDWNHAWGAAPANIIPQFMWGISPEEPGYSKAIIKPQLSNLTQSKIKVPTIRGNIEAEYNNSGSIREYKISIPGNMKCEFVLINDKNAVPAKIFLNNKETEAPSGNLELNPGINVIKIEKI